MFLALYKKHKNVFYIYERNHRCHVVIMFPNCWIKYKQVNLSHHFYKRHLASMAKVPFYSFG